MTLIWDGQLGWIAVSPIRLLARLHSSMRCAPPLPLQVQLTEKTGVVPGRGHDQMDKSRAER